MMNKKKVGYSLIGIAVFLLYIVLYRVFIQIFKEHKTVIYLHQSSKLLFILAFILLFIGTSFIIKWNKKGFNKAIEKFTHALGNFMFDALLIAPMALIAFAFVTNIEPKAYVFLGFAITFIIYFSIKEYTKRTYFK